MVGFSFDRHSGQAFFCQKFVVTAEGNCSVRGKQPSENELMSEELQRQLAIEAVYGVSLCVFDT